MWLRSLATVPGGRRARHRLRRRARLLPVSLHFSAAAGRRAAHHDRPRQRRLAEGTFIHANPSDPIHWGKGSASVRADSVFLGEDFEVGPGPKFHVYLVPKAQIRASGDLQGRSSSTSAGCAPSRAASATPFPPGLDLAKYQSVIIWCEQFSVLISPADLTPQEANAPMRKPLVPRTAKARGAACAHYDQRVIVRPLVHGPPHRLATVPATYQIWSRSMPISRSIRSSRLPSA